MSRQVVLGHFSIRDASFVDRCTAAHDAGFDGIAMEIGSYSSMRDAGRTDAELLGIIAEHDTRVLEVEALPMFGDAHIDAFVHVVATFRPERLLVVPPFLGTVDRPAAAVWLAGFADRAAVFDTTVAIGFLPFTDIPDAAAAAELVDRAGRENIRICIDAWHVFRGAGLLSLVGLDPAYVAAVRLNDGPLDPVADDYVVDCMHHREVPGDGEFDLRAFMELMPGSTPVTIEVPDDDLAQRPPVDVADLLMSESRRWL